MATKQQIEAAQEAWEIADEGGCDLDACWNAAIDAAFEGVLQNKLWLWKNFVKGKPEYWAFDNPMPCESEYGDPLVIGEPCGYAIFKKSKKGWRQLDENEIIDRIKRADARYNAPMLEAIRVAYHALLREQRFWKEHMMMCSDNVNGALAALKPFVRGDEDENGN